jgi:hypothetical protein
MCHEFLLAATAVRYRDTTAAVCSVEQGPQSLVFSIAAGIGPKRRHARPPLLQEDSPDTANVSNSHKLAYVVQLALLKNVSRVRTVAGCVWRRDRKSTVVVVR